MAAVCRCIRALCSSLDASVFARLSCLCKLMSRVFISASLACDACSAAKSASPSEGASMAIDEWGWKRDFRRTMPQCVCARCADVRAYSNATQTWRTNAIFPLCVFVIYADISLPIPWVCLLLTPTSLVCVWNRTTRTDQGLRSPAEDSPTRGGQWLSLPL